MDLEALQLVSSIHKIVSSLFTFLFLSEIKNYNLADTHFPYCLKWTFSCLSD